MGSLIADRGNSALTLERKPASECVVRPCAGAWLPSSASPFALGSVCGAHAFPSRSTVTFAGGRRLSELRFPLARPFPHRAAGALSEQLRSGLSAFRLSVPRAAPGVLSDQAVQASGGGTGERVTLPSYVTGSNCIPFHD